MVASCQPAARDRVLDLCCHAFRLLPKGRTSCFRAARRLLGNPERVLGHVDSQWFSVDTVDEDIAVSTYLWDRWEAPASALWVSLLRPGACVMDVGANKGYFSLLAARRVQPGGRVISYEPHPRNFQDLEITIAANRHSHWTARACAISSEQGTAKLYTPGWDEGVSGWGSMERLDEGPAIEVPTTTLAAELDELGIGHADVLKMDIEGHELEALRGAAPALRTGRIGSVLLEFHLKELGPERVSSLFGLMEESGYRPSMLLEDALPAREWRRIKEGGAGLPVERCLVSVDLPAIERLHPDCRPHLLWRRAED